MSLYSILRIRDGQPGNTQSRLRSLVMGTLVSVESEYGRHLETAFAKSTDSSLPLQVSESLVKSWRLCCSFGCVAVLASTFACFLLLWYNTLTKNNLGRAGLIWVILPSQGPLLREGRAGIQAGAGCRTEAEAVENDAHGLDCYDSLCLLSSAAWDHPPESDSAHSGLDPSHKSWMEKMPP